MTSPWTLAALTAEIISPVAIAIGTYRRGQRVRRRWPLHLLLIPCILASQTVLVAICIAVSVQPNAAGPP
jgi:hypothetical protein